MLARCDGNMSAAARATGSSTRAIKAAAEKHGLSWSPNVSGGTPSCLRRIDSEVLARVRANHRTDAEAAKSLGVGANTFWKECYRRGIPSPRPAHRLAQGSYTPPTFAEPTDDAWQARPRPFDKRNDPA